MMNMLMTLYAFPLQEKILISKTLNAYLDNPRTEEEVEEVHRYIEKSYAKSGSFNFPPHSDDDIVTLEGFITKFFESFSEQSAYINEFYKGYDRENIYRFISKMWVIARYEDNDEHAKLRNQAEELRAKGERNFMFMLEDKNPIIANSKQLSDYSYLLSLFIHTESKYYSGHSFLLDLDSHQFHRDHEVSQYIPLSFLHFGLASRDFDTSTDDLRWQFLPYVLPALSSIVPKLDDILSSSANDKIFYVASLLKNAGHDITDGKTKLVILVSIIELLLTHSPDFNRYNVEDSISKQFRLKASLLIYLNDKTQEINSIRNRLKVIYNLRSSIAHGNFKFVEKYIDTHSPDSSNGEDLDSLIHDLYKYIRSILSEFLADRALVEFLKEN